MAYNETVKHDNSLPTAPLTLDKASPFPAHGPRPLPTVLTKASTAARIDDAHSRLIQSSSCWNRQYLTEALGYR